jgi:hypothetical protein
MMEPVQLVRLAVAREDISPAARAGDHLSLPCAPHFFSAGATLITGLC